MAFTIKWEYYLPLSSFLLLTFKLQNFLREYLVLDSLYKKVFQSCPDTKFLFLFISLAFFLFFFVYHMLLQARRLSIYLYRVSIDLIAFGAMPFLFYSFFQSLSSSLFNFSFSISFSFFSSWLPLSSFLEIYFCSFPSFHFQIFFNILWQSGLLHWFSFLILFFHFSILCSFVLLFISQLSTVLLHSLYLSPYSVGSTRSERASATIQRYACCFSFVWILWSPLLALLP